MEQASKTADTPLRVLCVFSTLDRGGAESMCMNLYRNIDREKVQFDFVKHTDNIGAFEKEIAQLGGRIFSAPRYRGYNHFAYQEWWKKHLSIHKEHRIIHVHFFTMAQFIGPVAHKYGCHLITHSHISKADRFLKQLLIRGIWRKSDTCFACGKSAGEWLFQGHPFTVLNNAINTDQFLYQPSIREEVRREHHLEDCLVVGTVGRITPQKNPLGIVEIFNRIFARNQNARLMWIGDGPLRTEVEEKLRQYHLQEYVLMLGVRQDVSRLLQGIDVFILPSLFEGLPVVAIEAQAAGLRCFLGDTITQEANIAKRCIYLPIGQPEVWAEAILSADLTKVDTRQQIVDAGYDIHTTADWLQAYYLSLVQ